MNPPFKTFSQTNEAPWRRQRLRVPREDGAIYSRPELPEAISAIGDNAALLNGSNVDLQGRTLSHMREWTGRKLLESAAKYTAYLRGEAVEIDAEHAKGIIADGHQPSLFHPGVWVKNFAIAALAKQTGRVPLHLVVDNDTIATSALNVPAGTRDEPTVESVPFDSERNRRPWEEAIVRDGKRFASFGERVAAAMNRWGIDPLLTEMWPDAVEMANAGHPLRDAFTAARHRLERRWGLQNLELPLSRLGAIDPFLWFASHLFAQAPRFREVHNEVLAQFRRINRVRSRTHPVPELGQAGDWTETPFWMWKTGDDVRRQAYVRQVGREVELTDRADTTIRLPLSPEMDACCAVEVLRELPAQGIKLRTRALSTTLFARLCLSDLFVHGIGGAKYDEMTDRIIARFYGLEAPAFLTLSATVHLPLAEPFEVTADDIRALHHQLRDVGFNPERHAGGELPDDSRRLIAEKQRLIAEQQAAKTTGLTRSQRRKNRSANHRRNRRFQQIDRQLQPLATERRVELRTRMETLQQRFAANTVLRNREFSFALYPEPTLRSMYESESLRRRSIGSL